MTKNIKGTGIELTPAISEYIEKRFQTFERFAPGGDTSSMHLEVEVGKTTHHHKSGDFFKAEVNLKIAGKNFYAVTEKDDLYAAIDEVKDEIVYQITSDKDKTITLYRRGALKVKNLMKGMGDYRKRWKK